MGYQKKRLLKKVAAPARFFFRLKQKINAVNLTTDT